MEEMLEKIAKAEGNELAQVLKAVRQRYADLHPDWEVCVVSIDKGENRNLQIDCLISMIERMKKPAPEGKNKEPDKK